MSCLPVTWHVTSWKRYKAQPVSLTSKETLVKMNCMSLWFGDLHAYRLWECVWCYTSTFHFKRAVILLEPQNDAERFRMIILEKTFFGAKSFKFRSVCIVICMSIRLCAAVIFYNWLHVCVFMWRCNILQLSVCMYVCAVIFYNWLHVCVFMWRCNILQLSVCMYVCAVIFYNCLHVCVFM